MLKYNTYPRALEHLRQVSCWVNANEMKHPLNPKTLHGASNKWPNSWGTYDQCFDNLGRTNDRDEKIIGLGLELTPAKLNCIDLDHVIADDGSIDEDALAIVRIMNTYTERSMSGHGLHLFFVGSVPDGHACKVIANDRSRELYSGEHFILTSFDVLPGYEEIRDCTAVIPMVYERYYKPYEGTTIKKRQPRSKQPREPKQETAIGNEFYNLTPLAEAIVRRDADFIRNTLRPEKKQFDNAADMFRYIYSYPLDKFLGLDGKQFLCFFHDDHNPSGNIYRTGSHMGKRWVYHCASDNLTLTIKGVTEMLGSFDSEIEALDFIKSALNIEVIENEWTEFQRKTLDLILDRLEGIDEESFRQICPTAFSNTKQGIDIYRKIILHARRNLFSERANDRRRCIIFPMSINALTTEAHRGNPTRVMQWVKLFASHNMLYIMRDDLVPQQWLAKAMRLQKEGKHSRRVQFYMIRPQVAQELIRIENRGKICKSLNYTAGKMSYELIARSEGIDEANRIYPQRAKGADADGRLVKTTSLEANQRVQARHERIHTICVELLQEQGYFTMGQVIERYGSKSWSEIQAKRSIPEICAMYGLVRKKAGKELKARFNIETDGYPYIYYKEEDKGW